MKRVLLRATEFLSRFVVSIANFGFLDALRAHFLYRRGVENPPVSIALKPAGRRFHFRGGCDRGVLSHFWTRGYRIREASGSERIKYIIDGGANIGAESIRFRQFHPEATVLAVEADAGNFEVLKLNVAGDSKTVPIHAALWSKAESVVIEPGDGKENFRVRSATGSIDSSCVFAVTIEGLMHLHGFPRIDILKLDIEGAEKEVFGGDAASWLSHVRVLIIEPPDKDAPALTMQIFKQLTATGRQFDCHVHGENIVLIRRDVDWRLESDLYLNR